jgi:hypothetical protein
VNIHELKCPIQKIIGMHIGESKFSRSNVFLTAHPIERKSTMLKLTDKFKLEHLQDALLKTLAGQ